MASVRSEPDCSLSTLGSFSLRARGRDLTSPSTQKARALLTYLVLHRQSDVSRERLLDVFWPDADPQRARDSLNTAMHSIRRCFRTENLDPDDYVFANKSVVRWTSDIDIDVERLERVSDDADEARTRDALTAYRGEFLEGDYDEWTVTQRERVAQNYERILSRAVRVTKEPQIAKRLLARNPYDEDAYAALIDAELAAGRALSAAQIAQQCRKALEEIGVEPSQAFLSRFAGIERMPKRSPATIDVPFVGRDLESAQIFDAIQGNGDTRIVLIEGEPGIGKSALLERVAAQAMSSGVPVVSTRAIADDMRAFGTWRTLYESLCARELSALVRDAQGDVVTALASDILGKLPPGAVLFVDDAQYLKADSLEVLSAIIKRASLTNEHAIVMSTRPEGLVTLLHRFSNAPSTVLHLAPLSSAEVENAIALASIDLGDDLTELLERRAGGHPLYLKALLGQLVRAGALQREGGRWRLVHDEPALDIPASLAHLIEARIRSRGDNAIFVTCALALEPMASVSELAAATNLEELAVLDALDDLLGYRIIIEAAEGPRQFIFSHDLIQEVARGLLSLARRLQLHGSFAEILQTSDARDRDARRARHLEACGRYEDAAAAFILAAHETLEWSAPHATLELGKAGIACTM